VSVRPVVAFAPLKSIVAYCRVRRILRKATSRDGDLSMRHNCDVTHTATTLDVGMCRVFTSSLCKTPFLYTREGIEILAIKMWSIVQYKRLGKEVEHDWQMCAAQRQTTTESLDQDGFAQDLEIGHSGCHGMLTSLQKVTNKDKILDNGAAAAEEPEDNGRVIVECTSDDDSINPRNWPLLKRARAIAILFMLVFVQAWAGASGSLANSKASKQYHVSPVAENLSTAMYLFGIGTGCLFTGPLSESFGRNPVYLSFTFIYLFFVLGTALSETFGSQIVCRYLVGLSSSATLGINGATVNDLFRPVKRALWFPLIAWVNVVRKYMWPYSLVEIRRIS
jgi:DHA1 family multidrug resistance protein-like MFS transporter